MDMRRTRTPLLSLLVAAIALTPAAPAAGAAKRPKAAKPTITRVTPMRITIGDTLTIRGTRFKAKPSANTVVFQGAGGRTAFVKPRAATKTKLVLRVPASVVRLLVVRDNRQVPTRMQLRVLAGRFSAFTPRRLSPVVTRQSNDGPSGPGGNGGAGGAPKVCNSDSDHDNDLLSNSLELEIGTDPCLMDTDGDRVEDGFEYKSALDLNDDEMQDPNASIPYPGKRPYPNPLDPSDADTDYDGDVLELAEEQSLWRYAIREDRATRTLNPLYYSDGEQFSINVSGSGGRTVPALAAAGYERQGNFLSWATANGYRTVMLSDGFPWWDHDTTRNPYGLLDVNRDGDESATLQMGYRVPEVTYYDLRPDGFLSDDERDEDADGLTNYDETHGRMMPLYWEGCYTIEKPFNLPYAATDVTDPDSDGDGVRDGADDQDHDDVPNLMEISRQAASGLWDGRKDCVPSDTLPSPPDTNHPDAYGRVNPYNPCLPAEWSRTCTLHPDLSGDAAPFDDSLNWASLN